MLAMVDREGRKENDMNHLMEQIKDTFAQEAGVIEDTGGIDTELLESELRLRTGLFVGRVHLTSASCGKCVDVYTMQFSTPMIGVDFTITVDKRDNSVKVEQA